MDGRRGGGMAGRARDAGPLRVLAVAPGDPGAPLLELIGPHPLVQQARAAGPAIVYTVVTDVESAPRFAALPPGHALLAAPLWRVVPRARVLALRPAARLQTGISCLAELLAALRAARRDGTAPVAWDIVHGWGDAGALPAAALARALGLPWAWSPPVWVPGQSDDALLGGGAARCEPGRFVPPGQPDEYAVWCARWAGAEAGVIFAADAAQHAAIRAAWAPPAERLVTLPVGAAAGWDESERNDAERDATGLDAPAPDDAAPAPDPLDGTPRVALLMGRGTRPDEVAAVVRALSDPGGGRWPVGAIRVVGVGCRASAGAAALRREARRLGLAAGLAWRDLDAARPLPEPRSVLAGLDAAVILGAEPPPRGLLAWLGRAGVFVAISPDAGGVTGGGWGADPADPAGGAADLAVLANARRLLRGDRAALRRSCRAAWRAAVAGQAISAPRLGERLVAAYATC